MGLKPSFSSRFVSIADAKKSPTSRRGACAGPDDTAALASRISRSKRQLRSDNSSKPLQRDLSAGTGLFFSQPPAAKR